MIISIHDVWVRAYESHKRYVAAALKDALEEASNTYADCAVFNKVNSFIIKHKKELVDPKVRDFTASVSDYDLLFPPASKPRLRADKMLARIFNYDRFCRSKDGWNAYELCKLCAYVVCPYCHINTIQTVDKSTETNGYRPQLDHFIGKADYPFLSLSLGNLIPCCAICNGPGMKHMKNFFVDPHLSPLRDKEVLVFKLQAKGGVPSSPALRALRSPLEYYEIAIHTPADHAAALNSLKTFQLVSRYQAYVHDAMRLAKIGKHPAWVRGLRAVFNFPIEEKHELGFCPKSNPDGFKNIPQGKMRFDVYRTSQNGLLPDP